jgi:hypothetical protein
MSDKQNEMFVIRFSRTHALFLAAFFSALFSRIGMFLTGYTSDDYLYALGHIDATWHSIHQGRFLEPLLFSTMSLSGFTQTGIQLPLFIISLLAIAAVITKMINMALNKDLPLLAGAAAAAVAAAYPYLTSYYLFRMAILSQIMVYCIIYLALHVVANEKWSPGRRMFLGSVIVGAGCGFNQLVFIIFSVSAMAWFVRTLFTVVDGDSPWVAYHGRKETLWTLAVAPTVIIGSLLTYFPAIKTAQILTGIPGEDSYSIDATRGVLNVMSADFRLILDVLARGESIIPLYMKAVLLLILAVLTIQAAVASPKKTALCVGFLFLGLAISVAPMAVSSGGHVARIFVGAGFVLALFIALVGNLVRHPKPSCIALFVLCAFYAGSGATMFYQQHLLSQWDQRTAWAIYKDITTQFNIDEHTSIHLINGSKINGTRLSTYGDDDYGVNESALRADWSYAYPGLFNVATGRRLNVSGGPITACLGKPVWPKPGAIFAGEGSKIYVCL